MTPQTFAPLTLAEALRAARETRHLEIGRNLLKETPRIFREQFGNRPAALVADPNTLAAAGQSVLEAFRASGLPVVEPFLFRDPGLYAETRFVQQLQASFSQHQAIPVAIGSGTINDLTKLASHRTDRPYLVVATAASMDGYTAFGASITHEGSKQTFFCPAPAAVIADLDVIAAAPQLMNAWGYADLLSKVTAGADWILADALGVEPIHPQAWNIVQGRLREMVADPAGVRQRNPDSVARLVEGLMLGGFAMQAAQSSRPASGAEHQFSHLWDMQHHTHNGVAPSHGFKVGIGTLAVTALYERLFQEPLEELDLQACGNAWPDETSCSETARALFQAGDLANIAEKELRGKHSTREQLQAQLETLRSAWPSLRQRLHEQLLPLPTLKRMLQDAGAPVEPEHIGISRPRLRQSFFQALCIRRRFTVLDVAVRTQLLEKCVAHIFGPRGLWPQS